MDARRLVQLIVAPSALAFLVAGFLAGLVWLAATPLLMPRVDGVRSPGAPSARPATLQDAIDSVRRFAGAPGLVLEGSLQRAEDGASRGDIYYLETVSPIRGEDFFKVDARTGEVQEATFRGRLAPADGAVDPTPEQAMRLAEQFARVHFWGFDQLTPVDRVTRTGETGPVHSFKWSLLDRSSGAELPVSVSVAVAGRSGQVFWYLGQRDALQIDPHPAIGQEQAIQTARRWLGQRDTRWRLDQPASVRLQVLYDDDDRQQLVWSIVFAAREDGPRSSLRLLVDAQTGALIQSAA